MAHVQAEAAVTALVDTKDVTDVPRTTTASPKPRNSLCSKRIEAIVVTITRPAQTLYDLIMKPAQGGMPDEAAAAVQNLRVRVNHIDLGHVVQEHGRANAAVRTMLNDMEKEHRGTTG